MPYTTRIPKGRMHFIQTIVRPNQRFVFSSPCVLSIKSHYHHLNSLSLSLEDPFYHRPPPLLSLSISSHYVSSMLPFEKHSTCPPPLPLSLSSSLLKSSLHHNLHFSTFSLCLHIISLLLKAHLD